MNHIEKAYKAWRATVKDVLPVVVVRPGFGPPLVINEQEPRKYAGTGRYKRTAAHREANRQGALRRWATPSKRARHAVTTYWATLTPEQRSERQRKAAKKMWKRRKAEAR